MSLDVPKKVNERWSMDFMSDRLENGQRFRVLNIIDLFTRESLSILADFSFPSQKVISWLEELRKTRGLPEAITVDIPRPRNRATIVKEPAYYEIRNYLVDFLVNRSEEIKNQLINKTLSDKDFPLEVDPYQNAKEMNNVKL